MNTKNRLKVLFAVTLMILTASDTLAQVKTDYYSSLKGKKGAALKTAVYNIIKNANVLSYGSGSGSTWSGFYKTDRKSDNSVIDRYSNDNRYFTSSTSCPSGMNIEHSFPKSWWGGDEVQAYKDLYNLMPCETKINSAKSNYPMGKVTKATTDNGCTKVGTGSQGYNLWEPADKWKGDFARGYMYMATAYQDYVWTGDVALESLQQGNYPTLKQWAYNLYIEWAKADNVDETERTRNDAVSNIQGNRNPYVDFPNLMDYVWGDSVDYSFDPYTTVRTFSFGDDSSQATDVIYSAIYSNETGNCTINNGSGTSSTIWTRRNSYGWTATGFLNTTNTVSESSLITPEIDLTDYSDATLNFNHAVKYATSPSNVLSVEVLCDGNTTTLSGIKWPIGNSWTFNDAGDISLKEYTGKKIKLAFHYTSNTLVACTWEIKTISVTGKKTVSGISDMSSDGINGNIDYSQPYKTFSLDGRQISNSSNGMRIIRQNGKSWKIF